MKFQQHVNSFWQVWIDEKVLEDKLGAQQRLQMIQAIAPEVQWYVHTAPSEDVVVMRIAKMKGMSDKPGTRSAEPMWDYKIKFLQWLCV